MKWYNWILCLVNKERREALHKVVEEQRRKDKEAHHKKMADVALLFGRYGMRACIENDQFRVYNYGVVSSWEIFHSTKDALQKYGAQLLGNADSRVKELEEWKKEVMQAYQNKDTERLNKELLPQQAEMPATSSVLVYSSLPDPTIYTYKLPPNPKKKRRKKK